jgi:hypothetical protein
MIRCRFLLPALLAGLGVALPSSLPAPAGETSRAEKINKLIEQMGSGAFAERERATKELDTIGVPALEALRKAATSEDAEIKRRAQELLSKIEKRAESDRILSATRVHLAYTNTPIGEAVADIQKKSGYLIHLHDPEEKLKERKITLDTGETTFWHAFGLFCAKAGLVEATMQDLMQPGGAPGVPRPILKPPIGQPAPGALPAVRPAAPAKGIGLAFQAPAVQPPPAPPGAGPGGPAFMPGRAGIPFVPGTPGLILLKDGKPRKLPADDTSAIRIVALTESDRFGPAPEGEVLLPLEVTPEPRLQWQSLQSIHIDKALDDRGQSLAQITPQVPGGPGFPGAAPGMMRPILGRPVALWGGVHPQVAVHFKKGEKAARLLKELKGVISAQVLTEPKPIITADNLAKAAGKTFKGAEGGSIKILDVKTDEQKSTTIRFEFDQPRLDNVLPFGGPAANAPVMPLQPILRRPPAVPALPAPPPPPPKGGPGFAAQPPAVQVQVQGQGAIQFQGGGQAIIAIGQGGGPVVMGAINGLTVQDGKGNTLPVQMGPQQFRMVAQPGGGNALTATYTLLCQPAKGQGEPAKLVYLGRKRATIDIPFTLKDVPLP